MTRRELLKAHLLQNFKDFQNIKEPGGSDAANEIVADGLAKSIDEAIDSGFDIEFQGEFSCANINSSDKQPGYIYTTLDAGRLAGEPPLDVSANTVVMWNGTAFKTVLRLFPADYGRIIEGLANNFRVDPCLSTASRNPVQNRIVTAALNSEKNARETAVADLQERIEAVGETYETKADAKAKANAWGVGMIYQSTNTLKFYRPDL